MINNNNKFISYALNLAKKNLGATSSNPTVACVIVRDNEILATGVTAVSGRPHAETIAIKSAIENGKNLEGSTIYVTLEPCSHFGKTPPCIDEIIKNKIKKVVIAAQDPDERVNGAGILKLKEANIEVISGVLEKEAKEINKGFFKARLTKLPYITLKIATSLDGKIATKNFDSKWITSEKSRQFAHYLRSINDAILVGANTVKKDNPSLNCRIKGLEEFSPKKIVISNSLDFDANSLIFKNAKTISTTVITSANSNKKQIEKLSNLGVEFLFCEEKNNQVDLLDALKKLCESGINSILIEGGQNIATQFLKQNLVDELIWIRSKKIIGNDGIAAIGDMGFSKLFEVFDKFSRKEIRELDEDIMEIYKR